MQQWRSQRHVCRSRIRPVLCAWLALGFFTPVLVAAADREPTPEQVTERTKGLLSVWDALRSRTAGARIHVDQGMPSSGEFGGSRMWWLRTGASIEGGIPLSERLMIGITPSFAWERLLIEGSNDFIVSQSGRDTRFTDFYESSIRLGGKYRFTDTWGMEMVVGLSARHERGA